MVKYVKVKDCDKQVLIDCQQLEMLIQGKVVRGSVYPYTVEQAEKVASYGERVGCWE